MISTTQLIVAERAHRLGYVAYMQLAREIMTFTLKEKISITVLLFLTYLIPTVPKWLTYSSGHFEIIAISAPIWFICFYIGPFWLNHGLAQFSFVRKLHVVSKGIVFVVLLFVGAVLVNKLHTIAFSHYRFTLAEQMTSAVLWGVFSSQ